MPKVIEEFSKSTVGRPEAYPWAEWLDGQKRAFTRGTEQQVEAGEADFACTPTSFVGSARKAALKRGLRVTTVTVDESTLELAAIPESEEDEGTDEATPEA